MSRDLNDLLDNVVGREGDAMRWSPNEPDPTVGLSERLHTMRGLISALQRTAATDLSHIPVLVRRPFAIYEGLAFTDRGDSPSWSEDLLLGGWAYRRECPNCKAVRPPAFGAAAELQTTSPLWWTTATEPVPVVRRTAHICPACYQPLPAPAVWGRITRSKPFRHYEFRLENEHRWAASLVDLVLLQQSRGSLAAVVWRDLERELAEHDRPDCDTPSCDKPVVERFDVAERPPWVSSPTLRLCGREWCAGDRVLLCGRHTYVLLGGGDPARPGDLRPDLLAVAFTPPP